MNKTGPLSSVAVLGGSFNPLHFGHMRLAVEVYEALLPARLDFVPCANPPHKPRSDLLPFELRLAMLRSVTERHSGFYVNDLEAGRGGLSFTVDTLREYRRALPVATLYFVLGAEDFEGLGAWREWEELPELAELLVVARQGSEAASFKAAALRLWPAARPAERAEDSPAGGRPAFNVGKTGRVSYLALPRLDVSASLIRSRWLAGRSIDYWVPHEVIEILQENSAAVKTCWQRNSLEL